MSVFGHFSLVFTAGARITIPPLLAATTSSVKSFLCYAQLKLLMRMPQSFLSFLTPPSFFFSSAFSTHYAVSLFPSLLSDWGLLAGANSHTVCLEAVAKQ